jgi:putative thioredoxin
MFSPTPTAMPVTPAVDSVKDVDLANFVADVIEASKEAVVLVDFWATWCGPCKQLTPMLEKIARESKGAIRLAKVDIDKNQPIAQQMGVQSVPSVFAFYQGRPIDGFAGALPESQIKAWLDPIMKQASVGAKDDKPDLGLAFDQAREYRDAKDFVTARAVYLDILDMEPGNAPAYAGVIRCAIEEGDIAKARQMIDAAPPEIAKDKALLPERAALELAEQAARVGQGGATTTAELEAKLVANPADHQARFDLALAFYAAGKREEAVDQLLEIVRLARTWNEDAARKQLVKFFEAFGVMDPLTISARKRLSSHLFS